MSCRGVVHGFDSQLDLDPERPVFIDEPGGRRAGSHKPGATHQDGPARAAGPRGVNGCGPARHHGHVWTSGNRGRGLKLSIVPRSGRSRPVVLHHRRLQCRILLGWTYLERRRRSASSTRAADGFDEGSVRPIQSRSRRRSLGMPALTRRVGVETGAMTPWLVHGLRVAGVNVDCLDARCLVPAIGGSDLR